MISFLEKVAKTIIDKYNQLDSLIFILPGDPPIFQLKKILNTFNDKEWEEKAEFFTTQNFMKRVSNLSLITNTSLIFKSYELYQKDICGTNKSFEDFLIWAPKVLEDFNNLDLYMIEIQNFFSQMQSIEQLSQWLILSQKNSEDKKASFWKSIANLYTLLKNQLLSEKEGYQGLLYRQAADKIPTFLSDIPHEKRIIFIGLNALSKSEEKVIQYLLDQDRGEIYWDIDEYFLNPIQEAGAFVRRYFKSWPSLQMEKLQWISDDFKKSKTIEVIKVTSQIGQAKKVAQILEQLLNKEHDFSRTAVVLPEPSLLIPILNSIPQKIGKVTVSVNNNLQNTCWHQIFDLIFRLFLNREHSTEKGFYSKDLLELFSNIYLRSFFKHCKKDLIREIYRNKIIFVPETLLKSYLKEGDFFNILSLENLNSKNYIDKILALIRNFYHNEKIYTEQSHLTFFKDFFQSLKTNVHHISNLSVLKDLYKKWINYGSCNPSNESFEGLQILEICETQALDFDTVIITSVNEGIFPPDRINDSCIPFDICLKNCLPVYHDRDALYAYYFYHLLQRSKRIFLIYNTQDNELGLGEKSRFIYQLEMESPHKIINKITKSLPYLSKKLTLSISKTPYMMKRLEEMAVRGFSSSSISMYIRDPIMFYKQKVLNLPKQEEIKENIEKSDHGLLIHKSLQKLYCPFINQKLDLKHCAELRAQIIPTIKHFFEENFKESYQKGKNLLLYRVVEKQLEAFIDWEENNLRNKQSIRICSLERNLSMSLDSDNKIQIQGNIDRIDEYNGEIRIIDYKTGYVDPLSIRLTSNNLGKILQEVRFEKALQLMLYASLYHSSCKNSIYLIYPGIFSFQKIQHGLQYLIIDSQKKVNTEQVKAFLLCLFEKIKEILDPKIPLKE